MTTRYYTLDTTTRDLAPLALHALLDGAATALGKGRAEIDAFLDMIPTEA